MSHKNIIIYIAERYGLQVVGRKKTTFLQTSDKSHTITHPTFLPVSHKTQTFIASNSVETDFGSIGTVMKTLQTLINLYIVNQNGQNEVIPI